MHLARCAVTHTHMLLSSCRSVILRPVAVLPEVETGNRSATSATGAGWRPGLPTEPSGAPHALGGRVGPVRAGP